MVLDADASEGEGGELATPEHAVSPRRRAIAPPRRGAAMRICVSVRALELVIADPLSLGSLAPTTGNETWDGPEESLVHGWAMA